MKQAFFSLCVSMVLALLSGCSAPNSPTGTNGSITGVVTLGSELNCSSPSKLLNSAGVTISLDGTSLSTLSDSSGFWKIDNVPDGNYDVTITKSGFGLTRIYGVGIGGPGTAHIQRIDLGALPSLAPQLVSATVATVSWIDTGTQKQRQDLQISWKTPYDRSYSGLDIFLDKDSTVQPADVHSYSTVNKTLSGTFLQEWLGWTWSDYQDTAVYSTPYAGVIACPIETLHSHGITSGTKVYVTISQHDPFPINGEAPNNDVSYYDPVHNQSRLVSPSPRSNVFEVTIP